MIYEGIFLKDCIVFSNFKLKVNKSQKQFFLKLHSAQRTNEILDKILPYEARAEFCQIFRLFFGQ